MATNVTIASGGTSVTIRSTDFPQKTIIAAAKKLGKRLQEAVANNFQNMRTVDGSLKDNTAAHTQRKIFSGQSPLLGHMTGELQRALNGGATLWAVFPRESGAVIKFSDHTLMLKVTHAQYYIQDKTVGRRIMGVKADWMADIKTELKAILKNEPRTKAVTKPVRRTSNAARLARIAARARRRNQRTTVEVG